MRGIARLSIFFFALAILLPACDPPPVVEESLPAPEEASEVERSIELRNIDIERETDKISLRLHLGRMALKGDSTMKRIVIDEDLSVEVDGKVGKTIHIKAEKAFLLLPFREVDLFGGILVETEGKYEFELDHMNWRKGLSEIRCNGPVRILSENVIITGESLVASINFESFVLHEVRGVYELE